MVMFVRINVMAITQAIRQCSSQCSVVELGTSFTHMHEHHPRRSKRRHNFAYCRAEKLACTDSMDTNRSVNIHHFVTRYLRIPGSCPAFITLVRYKLGYPTSLREIVDHT